MQLRLFWLSQWDMSVQSFEGQTTIDTKSAGAIEARIINSGDRGILFFDVKNNQVIFLRWDEVKQITTRPERLQGQPRQ
jgi:hypothetical protein